MAPFDAVFPAPRNRLSQAALLMGLAACGRTGLHDDEYRPDGASSDASLDALPEVGADTVVDTGVCIPAAEVCNGKDDDCNGLVDDGLPAVPCPDGGFRYCVAGRMSECPKRCDLCIPGSTRVCFLSYCRYWGVQTCAADGRSFGYCREADPPAECDAVATTHKFSADLQKCCMDHGYCCRDDFDVNGNGDHGELLGDCTGVACK